jgi:hypothetical protein
LQHRIRKHKAAYFNFSTQAKYSSGRAGEHKAREEALRKELAAVRAKAKQHRATAAKHHG